MRPDAVVIAHSHSIPFERISPRLNLISTGIRVDESMHAVGVPLYRIHTWSAVPDSFLEQFDAIIVACFPRKLPTQRLERLGICAWNIHPSALPLLRGPDPLFYTARGDAPAAVTIHTMDAQYDTGPILGSAPVQIPVACDEHGYIALHAKRAAALYCQIVAQPVLAVPQPELTVPSWAHPPTATDFTLSPTWSVLRTVRFVTLTNLRAHPYWVPAAGTWVHRIGTKGEIPIRCTDGMIYGTRWNSATPAQV